MMSFGGAWQEGPKKSFNAFITEQLSANLSGDAYALARNSIDIYDIVFVLVYGCMQSPFVFWLSCG